MLETVTLVKMQHILNPEKSLGNSYCRVNTLKLLVWWEIFFHVSKRCYSLTIFYNWKNTYLIKPLLICRG